MPTAGDNATPQLSSYLHPQRSVHSTTTITLWVYPRFVPVCVLTVCPSGQSDVSDWNNALKLGFDPASESYPEWLSSQVGSVLVCTTCSHVAGRVSNAQATELVCQFHTEFATLCTVATPVFVFCVFPLVMCLNPNAEHSRSTPPSSRGVCLPPQPQSQPSHQQSPPRRASPAAVWCVLAPPTALQPLLQQGSASLGKQSPVWVQLWLSSC